MARHNRIGIWGERIACFYYECLGYHVVVKHFRTSVGEIDFIAQKGGLLACVEVKTRARKTAEIITHRNQERVCNAARLFIAKHPQYANAQIRMDAVLVFPFCIKRVLHAWECD